MANIYTRRDGKPRTTTFADFKFHKDFSYKNTKLQRARLMSPNRRQNPHSLGLIYQNPYNKDNLVCEHIICLFFSCLVSFVLLSDNNL